MELIYLMLRMWELIKNEKTLCSLNLRQFQTCVATETEVTTEVDVVT